MLAEISVATVGVLKQQGALVNPVFEKTRKISEEREKALDNIIFIFHIKLLKSIELN